VFKSALNVSLHSVRRMFSRVENESKENINEGLQKIIHEFIKVLNDLECNISLSAGFTKKLHDIRMSLNEFEQQYNKF
jgi:archaellum component FlaC